MRALLSIVLASGLIFLGGQPALANKRVALVIGNSAYERAVPLDNPVNDASAMTVILKQAGFDVVDSRRDLKIADMRRVLRDFADKSRDADVAVVYYAGHGIEVDGANYLVPVDAALERDLDVYDEAVSLDRVLATIEPAKQLRLVMLDACRDNPLARSMKRTNGTRAIGRGLAKVEPNSPNTLIAYASKAGSTASDGDSRNSPFTTALVKHIATPGLDLRKAFGYVRDEVLKNTGNKQEPYVYGSLGGDDFPLVPAKPMVSQPAATGPLAEMRRDYELAERVGTKEVWTAFLAQYPEGLYASLAKAQLNKLADDAARPLASAKATEKSDAGKPAEPDSQDRKQQVASLPAETAAPDQTMPPKEIARSIQAELKRVGCFGGTVDGEWNATAQRALKSFNARAGTKYDASLASLEILDAVKARPARICPLVCEHGFRADGDRCTRIACRAGYAINDDNECEKVQLKKPTASREKPKPERDRERKQVEAAPAKPQASGQMVCTLQGCRPVRAGCRVGSRPQHAGRAFGPYANEEICN